METPGAVNSGFWSGYCLRLPSESTCSPAEDFAHTSLKRSDAPTVIALRNKVLKEYFEKEKA